MTEKYDVIVVGAGHAGCEAAAAAANLGSKTLLITMDMTKFGQMSCNPAMGGIAKGQIVREIDALGGYSGIVSDRTAIQFRMLNRSKGPAMWSPRSQNDRMLFSIEWRNILEQIEHLDFWQDMVTSLVLENGKVTGVKTQMGITFSARAVVLTNGTFLNGLIHVGRNRVAGGRMAEPAATGLSEQLLSAGFETGRMKTGTPARLDGRTIDFSQMIEQKGDAVNAKFSFLPESKIALPQRSCYITYTNPDVHGSLEKGLVDSPLYNGTIQSIGPRYCPSIEDKIVTFADKTKHQLFLEPEGVNTIEYYLNGFSSSLPLDVQLRAMRKIPGLENVTIFRPGYAIEYDFFQPTQLLHTLETKQIKNLYFAGQINGTTGYEEAGAQGLIAGVNAHLKLHGEAPFYLNRDDAYIGVLIDDLVTKGVDEPYRMFTSRAEFRILLRQDNADVRLTEKGYHLGLASKQRYGNLLRKKEYIERLQKLMKTYSIEPETVNERLAELNTSPLKQKVKLISLVLRPQVSLFDLIDLVSPLKNIQTELGVFSEETIEAAEVLVKYAGYIDREKQFSEKMKRLENLKISPDFDYSRLLSVSTEARQKLLRIKPRTIGQASRISGVSPSDINVLLVTLGR